MRELISSPNRSASSERRLTAAEFQNLAEVPAAAEWFANLDNPKTRRAYASDIRAFVTFVGITAADQFRSVTRAHVIAWRRHLEQQGLSGSTIRRKLAALTSLFDSLLEANAVAGGNPVQGVKRPRVETNEGKTPALADHQARALLDAPDASTIQGMRDRALLAVLLYHGLRREEAAQLTLNDIQDRRGIPHLVVRGKGGRMRFLPLHPSANSRIQAYLAADGRAAGREGPLFKTFRGRSPGTAISGAGIYALVGRYAQRVGITVAGLGVHGLRATAATNALENHADIARVQQWLGHANIATTKMYDRRQDRPEESPSFRVRY